MSILKYYEVTCDGCGNGDYPPGNNITEVNRSWRSFGGIATGDGKHYCNKECRTEYLKKLDNF